MSNKTRILVRQSDKEIANEIAAKLAPVLAIGIRDMSRNQRPAKIAVEFTPMDRAVDPWGDFVEVEISTVEKPQQL